MQSGKIYKNQGVRKDGTFTDTTDVTSAGFAAQVNAAVTAAEAKGGTSETGGEFTFGTGTSGILTNEVNDGFGVPADQSKYLTSGNDVIDITNWTGTDQLTISDAFANDNDSVLAKFSSLTGSGGSKYLKLASIENLQIINSGDDTLLKLNGNNFKGLEAIKLIGEASNFSAEEFTYGIKVDATPNADTIIGSDKADTINGGAGNDIITGNDGNDVLTGGNGADTFVVGTVKAAGIDQILDFSAEDKIALKGFVPNELKKFDASTFSTVTYKTLDSVLATFGQNGANETKNGDIAIFTYDGKTYALLAKGAFDVYRDALIDITGTNVASLTESNFGDGEAVSQYNYANYTAFTDAIGFGVKIPAGEAIIQTMTTAQASELITSNLAKVADGGIKAITGKDPIAAAVTADGGIGEFDAIIFDSKLGADVVDVTLNINGSTKSDIIYASKLGGTITGGAGADVITAGASKDTFVQAKDSSVAASAIGINSTNIAVDDTLTFANGVDIIQGFGSDDVIKGGTGATKTTALGVAKSGGFTDNTTYYLSGNFVADTGVFTVTDDGVGADTLVFIAKGTDLTQTTDLTGAVVLVGVGSNTLSASNFEVA